MSMEDTMTARENVEVIREVFRAIETRDLARLTSLVDPTAEFHWPPSLPYGGTVPLLPPAGPTWADTWIPLQPTEAEQRMDPRIVAATDDEVVVLLHQRGLAPTGERCDTPVLALYGVRAGKLVRAQMFYFDSAALAGFLARSRAA
jgi:ketosteroid isomerase-like protein